VIGGWRRERIAANRAHLFVFITNRDGELSG
jgi:hypothetical protein